MSVAAGRESSSQSAGHTVRADHPPERSSIALEQAILNSVIDFEKAPDASGGEPVPRAMRFLDERSDYNRALRLLVEAVRPRSRDELRRLLVSAIARIDEWLTRQINSLIHQPQFQRLEASWRSLKNLVDQVEDGSQVKVKFLSVSWKELSRDQERAIEFDRSELWKRVYEEGIGMPGGEPFGVLIGDYEIQLELSHDHPQDMQTLRGVSGVAAAAFCPFIAAANPTLLGPRDFSALEHFTDFDGIFNQLNYLPWKTLRETEDSRFVGLTLPRVLVRLPYSDDGSRREPFRFREDVSGPEPRRDGGDAEQIEKYPRSGKSKYLWGNAAYAFAAVLIREFSQSRWLAQIRGVRRGDDGTVKDDGGLVANLPAHSFSTDTLGLAPKISTDVTITDDLERTLSELGFIPLCHCKDTPYSAFYSSQSIQKPAKYDTPAAATNARMSAMLQYIFCVSRFAHYIKLIVRDKTGTIASAPELERHLQKWLINYVTDATSTPLVKARRPLREGKVTIREDAASPGHFTADFYLRPHYELNDLSMAIKVKARLGSPTT